LYRRWLDWLLGRSRLYVWKEDSLAYGENWDKYRELWSPAEPDNKVMGSSVLWRTFDSGAPAAFPAVPWAMDVAREYSATSGTWKWEFSRNDLHQVDDAEYIRDHMVQGSLRFLFKC